MPKISTSTSKRLEKTHWSWKYKTNCLGYLPSSLQWTLSGCEIGLIWLAPEKTQSREDGNMSGLYPTLCNEASMLNFCKLWTDYPLWQRIRNAEKSINTPNGEPANQSSSYRSICHALAVVWSTGRGVHRSYSHRVSTSTDARKYPSSYGMQPTTLSPSRIHMNLQVLVYDSSQSRFASHFHQKPTSALYKR